jgi:integrase/recombinase XerD
LSHLDLSEGVVYIPQTKTGKPRTCGLSDEAVRCLRAYLKCRAGRGGLTLWSNRQRRPLSGDGLRQMLAERCKAAGLRSIGCHEFRRGLAERWLAAGGSESLLRYFQGWSSPAMVARYVRKNGQALAVAEHRRLLA